MNLAQKESAEHNLLTTCKAVLFRILGLVHKALTDDKVVSKRCFFSFLIIFSHSQPLITVAQFFSRNIYYQDPTLFRSQSVVNRYVDMLAFSLDVDRAALNVVRFFCSS